MNRLMSAAAFTFLAAAATAADGPPDTWQASNSDYCSDLDARRPAKSGDPEALERIDAAQLACRVLPGMGADEINRALGSNASALQVQEDGVTFFARSTSKSVSAGGSLETPMERVGDTNLWIARLRLAFPRRAMVRFFPHDEFWQPLPGAIGIDWQGPDAPTLPPHKEKFEGVIVRRTLWSNALQETRRLMIYLPPGYRADASYATLYMGDGSFVRSWAPYVERLIDQRAIPPIVMIGAEAGQSGIVEDRSSLGVELRGADYLPGFENARDRFARHMRFFATELVPYAEREFALARNSTKRAIQGQSNSAVFAGWAGIEHPEIFGAVIALSAGWKPIDHFGAAHTPRARFFLSAGLYEVGFYVSTNRTMRALQRQGFEVTADYPTAGHDANAWAAMMARYLPLVFPNGKDPAPN